MDESIELTDGIEEAEKLLGLLDGIQKTYEELPRIDFAEEAENAGKLLLLLTAIREEVENLPELPQA